MTLVIDSEKRFSLHLIQCSPAYSEYHNVDVDIITTTILYVTYNSVKNLAKCPEHEKNLIYFYRERISSYDYLNDFFSVMQKCII